MLGIRHLYIQGAEGPVEEAAVVHQDQVVTAVEEAALDPHLGHLYLICQRQRQCLNKCSLVLVYQHL